VLAGYNDLATTHPGLAAEWHPKLNGRLTPHEVIAGTNKRIWWQCKLGHEWIVSGNNRVGDHSCPYCSGLKAWAGFNDLASIRPDLAEEWHKTKNGSIRADETTVGSGTKVWWQCVAGHEWRAAVYTRSSGGSGCPACAKTGYDPTSPGFLYLLRKEHLDLQQFGITNYPDDRVGRHRKNGWDVLDVVGPADGVWIVETETALGHFFKAKGLLLPRDYPDKFDGFTESWRSNELAFSTCAEMLEALRNWETKV
jgi:hypothetical protein